MLIIRAASKSWVLSSTNTVLTSIAVGRTWQLYPPHMEFMVIKSDSYLETNFKQFQIVNECQHNPSFFQASFSVHINEMKSIVIIQILQNLVPDFKYKILAVYNALHTFLTISQDPGNSYELTSMSDLSCFVQPRKFPLQLETAA